MDQAVSIAVLKDCKELIEEKSVEVRPENLPDAILDENVDIHLIRKYFTTDAWVLVKDVTARKTNNPVYTCKICTVCFEFSDSFTKLDIIMSSSYIMVRTRQNQYYICGRGLPGIQGCDAVELEPALYEVRV